MIVDDFKKTSQDLEQNRTSLKESYTEMINCLILLKEAVIKADDAILLEQINNVLNNLNSTLKLIDNVFSKTIESFDMYIKRFNGNVEDLTYITKKINNGLEQTINSLKNFN